MRGRAPRPTCASLHDLLARFEVGHIVVCGMRTEVCVDTTCRQGVSSGYNVTLVSDGHTTTADPDGLTPAQIIAHHNRTLDDFGHDEAGIVVTASADIRFPAAPELRTSAALADA